MLKKRYLLPLAFLCAGWMASCNKKEADNKIIDPKNNQEFDFMTSKDSSWWRYGSRDGVSYTRYARNRDSVRDGIPYRYFEHKEDANNYYEGEFFVKNAGRFLTLIDVQGDGSQWLNYMFWKDGAVVGDTWVSEGEFKDPSWGSVSARVETEATEDNLSFTYGTHTYNKVHHAHSVLKASALNVKVGTIDMYYAENVGVIKQVIDINVLSQIVINHVDSLVDYKIY